MCIYVFVGTHVYLYIVPFFKQKFAKLAISGILQQQEPVVKPVHEILLTLFCLKHSGKGFQL